MRSGLRIAAVCLLAAAGIGAAGCARSAHERELRSLTKQLQTLQSQMVRSDRRLEQLSNRVLVLSHRMEVAVAGQGPTKSDETSSTPTVVPKLAVVRLVPGGTGGPARPESPPEPVEPPIVITVEGTTAPEVNVTSTVPPPPKSRSRRASQRFRPVFADALFKKALDAYRAGQAAVARNHFTHFVAEYSGHDQAANARYWTGVCEFELARYKDAVSAFLLLVKHHGTSDKVPDALLKMGVSYERLGQRAKAQAAFERIVASFPRSALAELAQARLNTGSGK